MDSSRLKEIHDKASEETIKERRHVDILDAQTATQETILRSFSLLIEYLQSNVSKTEVVNPVDSVSTPDVAYVVNALNGLHDTVKTHENVDLTEITNVMREVLGEVSKIPKQHQDITIPEQKFVDYTDKLKTLENSVKSVEKAVKALDLSVEVKPTDVTVEAPNVNVEAPDYSPIFDGLKGVKQAVKDIVIPVTDLSKLEKEQKKQTKILEEILDKPVGGGGGGSTGGLTDAQLRATPVPVSVAGGATELELEAQTDILEEIQQVIQGIATARGVASDLRVTIVGGGVTISSGTVTTVSTLTNQTQVGGYQANNEIPAMMNLAAVQSNINNVAIT